MNRSVQAAACCSLALLVTAGCSATTGDIPIDAMMANVSSAPKTPGLASTDGLPPGRVGALLLSDDDVSAIVGLPMHGNGSWQVPGAEVTLRDRDECKALTLSGKDFWTTDYTAYRQVSQQDSDDMNFFTWQGVAAYPNGRTASRYSAGRSTPICRRAAGRRWCPPRTMSMRLGTSIPSQSPTRSCPSSCRNSATSRAPDGAAQHRFACSAM